jgi:hypothetical protein
LYAKLVYQTVNIVMLLTASPATLIQIKLEIYVY